MAGNTYADSRRNVLWLVKGLGAGGAEQLLVNTAAVLDRTKVDPTVAFFITRKAALVPQLEELGVEVIDLDAGRVAVHDWATKLRRLLRERRFDVVHVHSPLVASVTRLVVRTLPKSQRPAIVTTEHNVSSAYGPGTRLANWATSPLDDERFAVSEDVRSSLPRRIRARTETLVHGVVVDELATHRRQRDRTRAQLGAADDDVVVLTLSNYRTQKGYDTLFEAARHTLDAAPRVRFFAAGQGPRRDEVERWHASYAFGSAFTLLGYRDDTANLLAAADVFVQASTSEGLPVAVMEALALGVPVVATRVGGIPEIVRHGVEGLLVPASDPTALADALLRLVTDPVLRETMSAAAAKRASVVDIATAARRYEECYAVVGRDR